MINALKRENAVKLLRRDSEVQLIRPKAGEILLKSLEEFTKCADLVSQFDTINDFADLKAATEELKKPWKEKTKEELYSMMLNYSDTIRSATRLCAKIVFDDWKKNLSDVNTVRGSQFSLLIRAVKPEGYCNERDYPIVSSSLFCPEHDMFYDHRDVAFILEPDADKLIMMSRSDSGTAKDESASIYDVPFCSRQFAIIDSFNVNDRFEFFYNYRSGLKEDDPGEVLFDSDVKVNGVIYCNTSLESHKQFARSYAFVYNLPVFVYDRDTKTITKESDAR